MHIIQKNTIELTLPSNEDGFVWQEKIARFCEETLVNTIEEILDEMDISGDIIEIDQIKIELDGVKVNDFEKVFIEAVKTALKIELDNRIRIKRQETSELSIEKRLSVHADIRAFTHFLEHGNFPWWSGVQSVFEMEEKIVAYLEDKEKESFRKLLIEIFEKETVVQRFISQFSESFKETFLHHFFNSYKSTLTFFDKILFEIKNEFNISITENDISKIIKSELIKRIFSHKILNINNLARNIFQRLNLRDFVYAQRNSLKIEGAVNMILFIIQEKTKEHDLISKTLDIELLKDDISILINTIPTSAVEEPERSSDLEIEGIYINNAGLVLLAPFLSEYLKACGIVENDELTDRDLAVHAIQYLVTGKEQTPENELVLNKILCGIPIETAIALEVELSDKIKNEAHKMLKAVIFYWDILQDTSVEGLRNSFLQRGGKISVNGDGDWLLQVEQAGYDILLGHLPWTYSIIKLPVMDKTLWVEWA